MNKVERVERHIIKKSHVMYGVVDEYSFKSKNLFNYANYTIRQKYISDLKLIRYPDLSKLIKHSESFKEMGSNAAQMTLRILDKTWISFLKAIKDYNKNSHKYLGKPRIPKYLKKNGRFVFTMTNVQTKLIGGYLQFSFKPFKPFNNLIKTNVKGKHLQTRFVPKGDHYILEIVYEKEVSPVNEEISRIIGIDLGLSRFATIQNNIGMKPFAINGGRLKSFNNYYNKQLAKYRSKAKKLNGLDWTKRLQRLTTKRSFILDNFTHKASKYILDFCIGYNIDTVIVGYNKGWKQEINIGKTTQHFVTVPFESFISKLEYKLNENGIKLIRTEESYTSKASFLDKDEMVKGIKFSGKRIERGLYRSGLGSLINADINGASNIIRKVVPNAFMDGIEDVHLHPEIINI